ncbi:hypothetical protein RSOLAG1IB_12147 [Rhizoctonia solani AG-1 IB]|uniref:Uncharacterized protein n=1 Tax=Thanatephorus cucumeris (strain AG1-IB / isolate 7/3/14) TaxID=1108050 RepID=A0A0B7FKQ4_THACB|nr:hypothetical protein RSOLAG1IB_12147 [Rhizoctonia solani AG-1 IB]
MAALSNHHLYPAEDGYGALGLLLSSRQLCELVKLGELDKYSRIVVEYIIQWTAAVFQSPQNTQVASWPTDYYFEDFLGAAAFVLENAPSEELKHKFLTSFMNASNIYLNQPARAQAQINSVRRIIQLVERYDDKLPHSLQHEELVLKCLRRPVNSSGGLGTFNDSDHVLEVGIGDISESPAAASPVLPPLPSSSTSENDRTEDDLV